jgi:pimeloyl-ACP methyl ester carboxylesterase
VDDQLALMDHLGHDTFHMIGCCIGCSFALKMIERAPGRVTAAVLQQPIGIVAANASLFAGMWRDWAGELLARRPDVDPERLEAFGTRMWEGEFVLSVSPEFVRTVETPLLVLPGIDDFHPGSTAHEVAELARNAVVVEPWKDSAANIALAVDRVRAFLRERTPVAPAS